jgi:hypothetical protein
MSRPEKEPEAGPAVNENGEEQRPPRKKGKVCITFALNFKKSIVLACMLSFKNLQMSHA